MANQSIYPDLNNETDQLFTNSNNLPQNSVEIPIFTTNPTPTAPLSSEWEYDFFKTPFNGTYDSFSNYTKSNQFTEYIDTCLRGVSQVIFINNPLTGIFFLTAIGITDPKLCLFGMIGLMTSTLFSKIILIDNNTNHETIKSGLYGYNGFLVGLAVDIFESKIPLIYNIQNNNNISALNLILIQCFMTIMLCILVSLVNIFLNKHIIGFTFPFHIISWCFLIAFSDIENDDLIYQKTIWNNTISVSIWTSSLFGVSQILFIDNMIGSILILIGIAISSRIVAISAFLGSLLGTSIMYYINEYILYNNINHNEINKNISIGLWGYNSAIIAVCIAGMFIKLSLRSSLMAVIFILFSVIIQSVVINILSTYQLPPLTFTSSLLCSVVLSMSDQLNGLEKPSQITTPEKHLISN